MVSGIYPGRSPSNRIKPVADAKPSDRSRRIDSGPKVPKKLWTFSWRYWRQIDYFGLDKTPATWFVSLLDKLKELSERDVEQFRRDSDAMDAWRFHPINWRQPNCPIRREDLTWLDQNILTNADEFPIYQFQVSQSLGRVAGFFGEDSHVFHIVLLDPHHNLQPAKSHNYRVDPCSPLSCDYSTLLYEVDRVLSACGSCSHAQNLKNIQDRRRELETYDVVMLKCDDATNADVKQLFVHGLIDTHYDIYKYGIDYLLNEVPQV